MSLSTPKNVVDANAGNDARLSVPRNRATPPVTKVMSCQFRQIDSVRPTICVTKKRYFPPRKTHCSHSLQLPHLTSRNLDLCKSWFSEFPAFSARWLGQWFSSLVCEACLEGNNGILRRSSACASLPSGGKRGSFVAPHTSRHTVECLQSSHSTEPCKCERQQLLALESNPEGPRLASRFARRIADVVRGSLRPGSAAALKGRG